MGAKPAITVRGLTKSFGTLEVLRGVDLDVAAGGVLALLGPNGAGKTTLVRILATLLRPDAGTATVAGFDVISEVHHVRRAISLTGQSVAVDELQTGEETLFMMGRLWGLSSSRPGGARPNCSKASASPTPAAGGWAPTPAGCAGGSTWPPALSPRPP